MGKLAGKAKMQMWAAGNKCLPSGLVPAWPPFKGRLCLRCAAVKRKRRFVPFGFTLLELLVVIAIIAMSTAGVTLAMRDTSQTSLEREAQRLAVLFESARAQSRASGAVVRWYATDSGFRFDGVLPDALPHQWLAADTVVVGTRTVQLGPEPIIGPQSVQLANTNQPNRFRRISTNGLQPFSVQEENAP